MVVGSAEGGRVKTMFREMQVIVRLAGAMAGLLVSTGCASRPYFVDRGRDAADMVSGRGLH
jgi:hypothetical protein